MEKWIHSEELLAARLEAVIRFAVCADHTLWESTDCGTVVASMKM